MGTIQRYHVDGGGNEPLTLPSRRRGESGSLAGIPSATPSCLPLAASDLKRCWSIPEVEG